MNALLSLLPVVILSREWEADRGGPPQLLLRLSTGDAVVVRWDSTYACRNLIVFPAPDNLAPEPCTALDVGLAESQLAQLVDEVAEATEAYERDDDERTLPVIGFPDRCYGSGR